MAAKARTGVPDSRNETMSAKVKRPRVEERRDGDEKQDRQEQAETAPVRRPNPCCARSNRKVVESMPGPPCNTMAARLCIVP